MLLQIVAVWYAMLRAVLGWGVTRRQPTSSEQPLVSVLVAARDEAPHLPHLFQALAAQTYPHYEVIIVDDRSTDDTPRLLADWERRDERVRSVRVEQDPGARSPKIAALQQGIAHAQGALLLFTDADCTMPPSWITCMAAAFVPGTGAVIGYAELTTPNHSVVEQLQAFDYFANMTLAAGATKLGRPLGAGGANIAYRRTAYHEAGGFAALPPNVIADDMALVQQIADLAAWNIAFCDDPGAVVRSPAVPTIKEAVNRQLRWMHGGGDVLLRNWPLLLISSTIGMFNGMLLGFPLFLRTPHQRRSLRRALLLRLVVDLLAYGMMARRVGNLGMLRHFPLWLFVQIVWTNVLPLLSLVRRWRWKDDP
jgi:cellulose synthase/poly-beta-1,6-N-acetylglucosamine synthase-like glycosyltransferase